MKVRIDNSSLPPGMLPLGLGRKGVGLILIGMVGDEHTMPSCTYGRLAGARNRQQSCSMLQAFMTRRPQPRSEKGRATRPTYYILRFLTADLAGYWYLYCIM